MKTLFLFYILFLGNILNAQSKFSLLFNFASSSIDDTLINSQLFDYDNDDNDEMVFIFKNNTNWIIKVFNSEGEQLLNKTDTLSSNSTLQFAKSIKNRNHNYLAFLSKMWAEEVNKEIKFKLEIIDLSNFQIVDIAEGYTWDFNYGPGYYNELNLKSLSYFVKDSNITYISVGWESYDEWTDIGETNGFDYYQNLLMFKFDGMLIYEKSPAARVVQFENCYQIFPISNLGIGGSLGWASGIWGSNSYEKSYFSLINFYQDQPIIVPTILIDFYGLSMLSSDDSTNYSQGIIFYRYEHTWPGKKKILSSVLLNSSEIIWSREDEKLQLHPITASANLSMDNQNYLCYFSDYTMQVIERNTGELVHYELSSISPIEILTTENNDKLFFITKSGSRTINIYKLKEINFVITDINELNNKSVPSKLYLSQNYPNPFNPTTIITYSIPSPSKVVLKISDILGNDIRTLVGKEQKSGEHSVEFDASDLPSGIYFYTLTAGNYSETKKMVLIQ